MQTFKEQQERAAKEQQEPQEQKPPKFLRDHPFKMHFAVHIDAFHAIKLDCTGELSPDAPEALAEELSRPGFKVRVEKHAHQLNAQTVLRNLCHLKLEFERTLTEYEHQYQDILARLSGQAPVQNIVNTFSESEQILLLNPSLTLQDESLLDKIKVSIQEREDDLKVLNNSIECYRTCAEALWILSKPEHLRFLIVTSHAAWTDLNKNVHIDLENLDELRRVALANAIDTEVDQDENLTNFDRQAYRNLFKFTTQRNLIWDNEFCKQMTHAAVFVGKVIPSSEPPNSEAGGSGLSASHTVNTALARGLLGQQVSSASSWSSSSSMLLSISLSFAWFANAFSP